MAPYIFVFFDELPRGTLQTSIIKNVLKMRGYLSSLTHYFGLLVTSITLRVSVVPTQKIKAMAFQAMHAYVDFANFQCREVTVKGS